MDQYSDRNNSSLILSTLNASVFIAALTFAISIFASLGSAFAAESPKSAVSTVSTSGETELSGQIKTSVSEAELNGAHQHIKNKDYKRAYRQFKKLANRGCPYSQCIVGLMHHKGVGTKKSTKKAIYWYEKSANQGWKDAEHRLGMIHLTGDGVEKNFERGVQLLQSAAKHGVFEAQLTLEKIQREGAETLVDMRNWVTNEASKDFNQAKAIAGQVPNFSGPGPDAAPKSDYERGLMNIQKSWTGYGDVVKNLESVQNSANR